METVGVKTMNEDLYNKIPVSGRDGSQTIYYEILFFPLSLARMNEGKISLRLT